MIFLVQFGINKHLWIFSKTTKIARARRAHAYLFQIALEIMWLPILIRFGPELSQQTKTLTD